MRTKTAIKEIGHLGLGYKTLIEDIKEEKNGKFTFKTKTGTIDNGLEIYIWADDFSHRWTIAHWVLNEKENTFELKEIGDRLANPMIDWVAFGELYNLGREMLDTVERFLD